MGEAIRYPVMKSVKDAAEIYGYLQLTSAAFAELAKYVSSMRVTAGWSTWTVWRNTSTKVIPALWGRMKPWAASAGWLGGNILEHTEL